jgi:hypothetical protein
MSRQNKNSPTEVEENTDLLIIRNKTKWNEPQINEGKQCTDTIKAV